MSSLPVRGYPFGRIATLFCVDDDYSDIEDFMHSAWGVPTAVNELRPLYPKLRRLLRANGVENLSVFDALAANLVTEFIRDHKPDCERDRAASHDHRNLLSAQGAATFRTRGWKP